MEPYFVYVITLRERWMLDFMNQVTDKEDWTSQVHDEKIIAQWKEEVTGRSWDHNWAHAGNYRAAAVGGEQGPHNDFTDEMFQYVSSASFDYEVLRTKHDSVSTNCKKRRRHTKNSPSSPSLTLTSVYSSRTRSSRTRYKRDSKRLSHI